MTSVAPRLPGSVAEVAASEEGPHVGAFFDLDGTIIAGYSASHLQQHRFRNREVGLSEIVRTLGVAVDGARGRGDGFADILRLGARAWRGRDHADLDEMGEQLFQHKIEPLIYPEMRNLVMAHVRRGHTVVLSSSATSYQVEPVARFLGIDHVLCNRFEVRDGVLTGDVVTPVLWGPGKADAAQAFAARHHVDMDRSYFYADGNEDVALMYLVGHPRPTNPGSKLAKVAAARGWPVLRLKSRPADSTGDRLRSTASAIASVPFGALGTAVGAVTRNRRNAVNFTTQRWLESLLRISKVTIETSGGEHLRAIRPALFVFNHRNTFDPLLAARLVHRDFVAVVPAELRTNQLIAAYARLADVTADTSSLDESLSAGLSALVAPETPRVDTSEVGVFDTAAFRAAMRAGVPIVPVVIHDADMVASRNASLLNAGTVHVTVLPPVPTEKWTPRTLTARVGAVREQFLGTLRAGYIDN
jgi:putative phosphoserine phosphatase / 1-acylglycerol-3-phosphate O-acyltransferase